jgi:hypothetical protein
MRSGSASRTAAGRSSTVSSAPRVATASSPTCSTSWIRSNGPHDVLSARALNRALLARQGLLERWECTPAEAIERLVGMQAQLPAAPYVGLHTRLERFDPAEVGDALVARSLVRIALMRSTVHLVTARDCLRIRPLIAGVLERQLWRGSPWGKRIEGIDVDALVAAGRELLDAEPRTGPELGQALHERFPRYDGEPMANAIRNLVPLVQLPPRGVWGTSGVPRLAIAERWLGAPLAVDAGAEELVLRYLAAFGPASVADAQTWSGLTTLREVFEGLRGDLVTLRDEDGRELFDVPDGPRPDPSTPAPPRFLPEYDNLLLSHAERERVIARPHRARVFSKGALLVDGVVHGTWRVRASRQTATLAIEPFRAIARRDAPVVAREGRRLLAFAAAASQTHEVTVLPVG